MVDRLRRTGYVHPSCVGDPKRGWRATDETQVGSLLALALRVAGADLPELFRGSRLDPTALAGLRARLERVLAAAERAERGQLGAPEERAVLHNDAALLLEPYLAKLLAVLEPDKLAAKADPATRLDLPRLLDYLRAWGLSPFDPAVVALDASSLASPAGWGERDTLSNALRDVLRERIDAAHKAPMPSGDEVLRVLWCAIVLTLAITEKNAERLLAGAGEAAPEETMSDSLSLALPEVRAEQALLSRSFVGREHELNEIESWIDLQEDGGFLVVTGPRGQGKSALIARLASRLMPRKSCLLHMIGAGHDPETFTASLLRQADALIARPGVEDTGAVPIGELRDRLVGALEALVAARGKAVVLLDALDELDASTTASLNFLPRSLPSGVRWIVTTRPDRRILRALRDRLRSFELRELSPLRWDEFELMMEQRLDRGVARVLAERSDVRTHFDRTEGNALLLCRAVVELTAKWQESAGDPRRLKLDQMPATLDELFESVLTLFEGVPGGMRLLELLCVSRAPLCIDELAAVSNEDRRACRDFLQSGSQYLAEVAGGRFKPWHEGLRDYVCRTFLGSRERLARTLLFVDWCEREPASRYAIEHRILHLLAVERASDAANVILEPRTLEARAEAGLVLRLGREIAQVTAALPVADPRRAALSLLSEALLADQELIQRHPGTTFQCLWNRLWWHDSPRASDHYEAREHDESVPTLPRSGFNLDGWAEVWRGRASSRAWLRAQLPPADRLACGQLAAYPVSFVSETFVPLDLVAGPDERILVASRSEVRIIDRRTDQISTWSCGPDQWIDQALPDARRVVVCNGYGTWQVIDVMTNEVVQTFWFGEPIAGVVVSPDGDRCGSSEALADAPEDDASEPFGKGLIVENEFNVVQLNLPLGDRVVRPLRFSNDGRLLVLRTVVLDVDDESAQRLTVVDISSGRMCDVDGQHDGGVDDVRFDAQNRFLYVFKGGLWFCHDVDFETNFQLLTSGGDGSDWCFAVSPSGRWIARGGAQVRVSDDVMSETREYPAVGCDTSRVAFTPDGSAVVSAHFWVDRGMIRVWDADMTNTNSDLIPKARGILAFDVDTGTEGHIVALHEDSSLVFWNATSGEAERRVFRESWLWGAAVAWLGRDRVLMVGRNPRPGDENFHLQLVDAQSGQDIYTDSLIFGGIARACDAFRFAYRSATGVLLVVDALEGRPVASTEDLRDEPHVSLAISPCGERVVASSFGNIRAWALSSDQGFRILWQAACPLGWPNDSPFAKVSFTEGGATVAVESGTSVARWNVNTGQRIVGEPLRRSDPNPSAWSLRVDQTELAILDLNGCPIAWGPKLEQPCLFGRLLVGLLGGVLQIYRLELPHPG